MTSTKSVYLLIAFITSLSCHANNSLNWDLGAATGHFKTSKLQSNDVFYSEAQLGVNYMLSDLFTLRGLGFIRFPNQGSVSEGIDLSGRISGIADLNEKTSVSAFAGPGFRLVTKGGNVPFLETGLIFRFSKISIGGGLKVFLHSLVGDHQASDLQYNLLLSGQGHF